MSAAQRWYSSAGIWAAQALDGRPEVDVQLAGIARAGMVHGVAVRLLIREGRAVFVSSTALTNASPMPAITRSSFCATAIWKCWPANSAPRFGTPDVVPELLPGAGKPRQVAGVDDGDRGAVVGLLGERDPGRRPDKRNQVLELQELGLGGGGVLRLDDDAGREIRGPPVRTTASEPSPIQPTSASIPPSACSAWSSGLGCPSADAEGDALGSADAPADGCAAAPDVARSDVSAIAMTFPRSWTSRAASVVAGSLVARTLVWLEVTAARFVCGSATVTFSQSVSARTERATHAGSWSGVRLPGRCRWAGEGGRLAERAEIEVAEREPVARHRRSCSLERGRVAEGRAALGVDRGVDGGRIAHEEHVLQDPERKRRAVAVIGRDGDACVGLRSCPGSERVVGPRPGRRCVLDADEQEALGRVTAAPEPGAVAAAAAAAMSGTCGSTMASESPSQPLMLPVKVWLPLVADPTSWSSASSSFRLMIDWSAKPGKCEMKLASVLALVARRVHPDLDVADRARGHVADQRRGRGAGRQDHESDDRHDEDGRDVTMPAIAHLARDPRGGRARVMT